MRKSESKARARNGTSGKLPDRSSRVLPTLSDALSINVRGVLLSGKTIQREIGGTLLMETERALRHPGLARRSIFTTTGVSSYSAYTRDPSKIVRESTDGTKTVGRLVNGRFRPTTDQ